MNARFFSGTNPSECQLCHHRCVLKPGSTGRCGVRRGTAKGVELPWFGMLSALHSDPIEKKPLFHFAPGTSVLSAGFLGCNLACPFCQNYTISQGTGANASAVSPTELVAETLRSTAIGIAYTYNEPTIHIEYVLQAVQEAKAAGLANVLVTNGSILTEPARELLSFVDAVNVDLKAWTADAYRRLGGDLETTREFIEIAATISHVEVTTLVVPGISDETEHIEGIASYLASISPEIPYHLSAYHPTYRYHAPATSSELIRQCREIAQESLKFVYTGNTARENETHCDRCGSVLVARNGYAVDTSGLAGKHCARCGERAPFVFPDS